jgi:ribosome-binding protein aMBF1 (putative translation factor)
MGVEMPRTIGTPRHLAVRDFIVAKRGKSGLTQRGLAAKLRVPQSYIASIETGQRRLDLAELIDLARVLRFDLHELVRKVAKVKR